MLKLNGMLCNKVILNKAVSRKKKDQGPLKMYSNPVPPLTLLNLALPNCLTPPAECFLPGPGQEHHDLATAHPLLASSPILDYLRKFHSSEL